MDKLKTVLNVKIDLLNWNVCSSMTSLLLSSNIKIVDPDLKFCLKH